MCVYMRVCVCVYIYIHLATKMLEKIRRENAKIEFAEDATRNRY